MRTYLKTLSCIVGLALCAIWAVPGHATLSNRLANHPSPYLALHGQDPVAWQDWGPAVMELAKREKKLIYLSIGYFSCHWCHVMQRESYQNKEIAEVLNKHFIPVKIDRELEPALDQRMMEFVEATRGMGGWPLNAFITPDGHPLYATLYHPPEEFLGIVLRIEATWSSEREKLSALAKSAAIPQPKGAGAPKLDPKQVAAHVDAYTVMALKRADDVHGGFGDQSKFPMVPQLEFLLSQYEQRPNPKLKEFLLLTLDHMAAEGLQDHLDGGFFRYTVDQIWKTPHFEKMLYDNVLLGRLYLRAAGMFQRDDYRRLGQRTLTFVLRWFGSPSGGLMAALSAVDAQGVEGAYYLWSEDNLKAVLSKREMEVYRLAHGMHDAPPFDEGYLPIAGLKPDAIAKRLKLDKKKVEELLNSAENKLRAERARRDLPRDTKVIAAWNGLALGVFASSVRMGYEKAYRGAAESVHRHLATELWDGKQLHRTRAGGQSIGQASLEDYAYVAWGLAQWAQVSGKRSDYELARRVMEEGWKRFYNAKTGWRLAEKSLIAADPAQDILPDGPMPSPSAVLLDVSLHLAEYFKDDTLRKRTLAALNTGHAQIKEDPFWYPTTLGVMSRVLQP